MNTAAKQGTAFDFLDIKNMHKKKQKKKQKKKKKKKKKKTRRLHQEVNRHLFQQWFSFLNILKSQFLK